MSEGIESLLAARGAEGRLESQGTFSIDPRAARQKLAQFGLDGPDKGLLRLLQLAVVAASGEAHLKITRDGVELYIHQSRGELFDLCKVSEPVTTALLACLYSGFESGWVSDPENRWRLTRTGFHREEARGGESGVVKVRFRRGGPEDFWSKLRALLEHRVHDTSVLQNRLKFCPIPLTLDGRPLNGGRSQRERCALDICLTAPESHLDQSVWSNRNSETWTPRHTYRGGQHFRAEDNPGKYWDSFAAVYEQGHPALFGFEGGKSERPATVAHLWLPMSYRGTGVVSFVQHGVVVGSHSTEILGHPVCGAVSASALDMDVSGLAAVNNAKIPTLMEYIVSEVRREVKRLQRQKPPPDVAERLRRIRVC